VCFSGAKLGFDFGFFTVVFVFQRRSKGLRRFGISISDLLSVGCVPTNNNNTVCRQTNIRNEIYLLFSEQKK